MDEFTSNLFQYLSPDKIMTLSCGHVVPKTSLLAMVATKGVRGVDFEFTHGNRESRSMVCDITKSIISRLLTVCSLLTLANRSSSWLALFPTASLYSFHLTQCLGQPLESGGPQHLDRAATRYRLPLTQVQSGSRLRARKGYSWSQTRGSMLRTTLMIMIEVEQVKAIQLNHSSNSTQILQQARTYQPTRSLPRMPHSSDQTGRKTRVRSQASHLREGLFFSPSYPAVSPRVSISRTN